LRHGSLNYLRSRFALRALDGNMTLKIVDTDIEEKDYLQKNALLPKGEKVEKKKVRSRGGLVFKAHRPLYHSALSLRVIKKKKKKNPVPGESRSHTQPLILNPKPETLSLMGAGVRECDNSSDQDRISLQGRSQGRSHMQTLAIYRLGFNQNYNTFT